MERTSYTTVYAAALALRWVPLGFVVVLQGSFFQNWQINEIINSKKKKKKKIKKKKKKKKIKEEQVFQKVILSIIGEKVFVLCECLLLSFFLFKKKKIKFK